MNVYNKWTCQMCTYMNWSQSKKCVICCAPKADPSRESNISPVPSQESLVATMNRFDLSSSPNNDLGQFSNEKWICSACTFSNWANSTKCVQCSTSRPETNIHTSNVNNVSTNSLVATSNHSPDLNIDNSKWICTKCTYNNWPKSTFCVMCQNDRPWKESENQVIMQPINNNTNEIGDSILSLSNSPSNPSTTRPGPNFPTGDESDFLWLSAIFGVLENKPDLVAAYFQDPRAQLNRKITRSESRLIQMCGIQGFEMAGFTLLKLAQKSGHLNLLFDQSACRWQYLASLAPKRKCLPCQIDSHLTQSIEQNFLRSLDQGKWNFRCYFVRDCFGFSLPKELFSQSIPLRLRVFMLAHCVDGRVQHELEFEEQVINWWCDQQLNFSFISGANASNFLFTLWNRGSGDCLLDSVMQSVFGILDRQDILRSVLANSMVQARNLLYERWKSYEIYLARKLGYTYHESQLGRDWNSLIEIAGKSGESLEQAHIFALAHIFRRPIIVYGVKYIHNQRDEPVGYANYQGVYLPSLWTCQEEESNTFLGSSAISQPASLISNSFSSLPKFVANNYNASSTKSNPVINSGNSNNESSSSSVTTNHNTNNYSNYNKFIFRHQPIILAYTHGHFTSLVLGECGENSQSNNEPSRLAPDITNRTLSRSIQHVINNNSSSNNNKYAQPDKGHKTTCLSNFITSKQFHSKLQHESCPNLTDCPCNSESTHEDNDDVSEDDLSSLFKSNSPHHLDQNSYVAYLPLFDRQGELLPVHFLLPHQYGQELEILHKYFEINYSQNRLPLFTYRWSPGQQNPLISQLKRQWVDFYREKMSISPVPSAPFSVS